MRVFLMKIGFIRRTVYLIEYMIPCIKVAFFTKGEGIYTADGRTLIRGKWRRLFISMVPPLAKKLQKHYGQEGGCRSCGASCKLLLKCPHWDDTTNLCTIYEDRPPACRFFPITPGDIRDRNIILKDEPCGFVFTKPKPGNMLKEPLKDGLRPVIKAIKSVSKKKRSK